MKKIYSSCLSLILASLLPASFAHATNLVSAYNQALTSDPTFKQAEATWLGKQAGIGVVRGDLLPQIKATSDWSNLYTHSSTFGGADNFSHYDQFNYGLSLSQPIFNFKNWALLGKAQYDAKSQQATYNAAAQTLISSLITKYFTVLESYNTLHYNIAQKNADYQQYITSKQQFKVGLKAVTDVYAAQSSYDTDVATVIGDRNQVSNDLETLSEMTGVKYTSLTDIAKRIPLAKPAPANINAWVEKTKQQNYGLLADRYTLLADKNNINAAFSGHYPTISFTGQLNDIHNQNGSDHPNPTVKNSFSTNIGISTSLPIFSGGSVVASTEQARYQYVADSQLLESDLRSAVSTTRQAYLTVLQDIAKIRADKEAITSSSKALTSTEAGYHVGTQTIYNVLTAITTLYSAQQNYYKDQYDYLQQLALLKQQAGILTVNDVRQINRLLTRKIDFTKKHPSNRPHDMIHKVSHYPRISHRHDPLQPGDYTIQLYAGRHLHGAQSFYQLRPNKASLHIIRASKGDGKAEYKVTFGSYTSYLIAKRALKKVPGSWRHFKPWIILFTRGDQNLELGPSGKQLAPAKPATSPHKSAAAKQKTKAKIPSPSKFIPYKTGQGNTVTTPATTTNGSSQTPATTTSPTNGSTQTTTPATTTSPTNGSTQTTTPAATTSSTNGSTQTTTPATTTSPTNGSTQTTVPSTTNGSTKTTTPATTTSPYNTNQTTTPATTTSPTNGSTQTTTPASPTSNGSSQTTTPATTTSPTNGSTQTTTPATTTSPTNGSTQTTTPATTTSPYNTNQTTTPATTTSPTNGSTQTTTPATTTSPYNANQVTTPATTTSPYNANQTTTPATTTSPYNANQTTTPATTTSPYNTNQTTTPATTSSTGQSSTTSPANGQSNNITAPAATTNSSTQTTTPATTTSPYNTNQTTTPAATTPYNNQTTTPTTTNPTNSNTQAPNTTTPPPAKQSDTSGKTTWTYTK